MDAFLRDLRQGIYRVLNEAVLRGTEPSSCRGCGHALQRLGHKVELAVTDRPLWARLRCGDCNRLLVERPLTRKEDKRLRAQLSQDTSRLPVPIRQEPVVPVAQFVDVEAEFGSCVGAMGGQVLERTLGNKRDFQNADYLFADDEVIGELKCLAEDQRSEVLIEKASRLYEECEAVGAAPVIGRGTFRTTTEGFPELFTRQILELNRRPIQRHIDKADHQIQQTKERLQRPNCRGLLLLANEGRVFLDPAHILWMVNETALPGIVWLNSRPDGAGRVEVEPAAVEVDRQLEALPAAKAA